MNLKPAVEPSKAELARARALHRASDAQLSGIRSAAAGWQKGLSGLVAGVAAFGIFSGAEDVAMLAAPWNVLAGSAVAASLAVSTLGAYLLLRAAHGIPRRLKPEDLVASDVAATRRAFQSLTRGISATLMAAVLAAAALGLSWYAPRERDRPFTLTTPTDELCGQLVRWSDDQVTIIANGVRTTLPGDDVQTLSIVEKC